MKLVVEHPRAGQVAGEAEFVNGKLWIHLNGRTICIDTEEKASRSKGKKGKNLGVVAPMPGKVTKILKSVEDSVLTGDPVLVMEAMKMEYTLKSDKDGQLKELFCKVGDQVPLGKLLAKVES
ncbi:MAG: acetyl-CoA carboxylase biotin carboxyl carrier protein subunit [Proteobacteria bacterium]|jgi:biotin carboxyl carrier protein|nr:acetyl-CoA carboxylase biotin carboxyl carrier protein subunit [Pseudomonadota bacterium]